MKAFVILVPLTLLALCTGGCTRTYLSHGGASPDGYTELVVTCHGAVGRAYMAKSKKLVDVWIGPLDNSTTLFSRRYKFTGSDVYWQVNWRSPNAVAVDLFDFGEGVLTSEGEKLGAPSNHIATLEFLKEKETGKFKEKKS